MYNLHNFTVMSFNIDKAEFIYKQLFTLFLNLALRDSKFHNLYSH